MSHTDLESKHINDMCHVTKSKLGNKVNIKDINNTINVMVDMAYNDKQLNNIYNKKYVIINSLRKLHANIDNHHTIIDTYDDVITNKLNHEKMKRIKKRKSCSCF